MNGSELEKRKGNELRYGAAGDRLRGEVNDVRRQRKITKWW
jgi:hypothetical protein